TLEDNEQITVFVDVFVPQARVMIFGAGHDAIPVAKYSVSLGYDTTVVDAREGFNTEALFPNTKRIIAHPESYAEKVTITENTYVIVMNHHIEKDRKTLEFVLPSNAAYVGVLGPRSRRERMMNQLRDEGVFLEESELQKMYNPVGLDIGAEKPEEIAISILSEIILYRTLNEVFSAVYVVVGYNAALICEQIKKRYERLHWIINLAYEDGQSTSLKVAFEQLKARYDHMVLFLGDMPCIQSKTI